MIATGDIRIRGSKARAIVFLDQETDGAPKGQQMTLTLPAGTYRVIGTETIGVSDRGELHEFEAVRMHGGKNGGTVFYVHPSQLPAT